MDHFIFCYNPLKATHSLDSGYILDTVKNTLIEIRWNVGTPVQITLNMVRGTGINKSDRLSAFRALRWYQEILKQYFPDVQYDAQIILPNVASTNT